MKKLLLAIVAIVSMIAPVGVFAGSDRVEDHIFTDYVRRVYRDRAALMAEKRAHFKFSSGRVVEDCTGFLEEEMNSAVDNDWGYCDYAICHVLYAFMKAAPSSGYKPESFSKELLERLEWKLILDLAYPDRIGPARTLAVVNDPLLKMASKFRLERNMEEGLYYSLNVLSDADLNGNTKPDWLISYSHKWQLGTERECLTGIIWDVEPTGPLRVDQYPLRPK